MDTQRAHQIEVIHELGAVTTETKGSPVGFLPDDQGQYRTPIGIADD